MATIAVLFAERGNDATRYVVHDLAASWREEGHEVVYLRGTRHFVPADLLLLHVDLSVVPQAYLEFADRYPKVLNRKVIDIRKSQISELIVGQNDQWAGPVIVKSDLNSGGAPERAVRRTWLERRFSVLQRARQRAEGIIRRRTPFLPALKYQVYPDLGHVPNEIFRSEYWVVEKFVPEMEGSLFHVRMYQCLGDKYLSVRVASPSGLVKVGGSSTIAHVDPHPIVEQWRRDLGLDYGKLDYVVHNGEAILLDVNKTVGAVTGPRSAAEVDARRRYLATGISAFM